MRFLTKVGLALAAFGLIRAYRRAHKAETA